MLLQYGSGRECAASWRSTTLLSKSLYLVIKYYIGDALVHDVTRLPIYLLTVTSTVSDVVTQLFILGYSIQLPAQTFLCFILYPCKYFYTKKVK